jgi:hypothetical protein
MDAFFGPGTSIPWQRAARTPPTDSDWKAITRRRAAIGTFNDTGRWRFGNPPRFQIVNTR